MTSDRGRNGRHSEASQKLHATLSTLPCPVPDGCGGICTSVHPRGIVLTASGRWYPMPPVDLDAYISRTKDAHDL